MKNRTCDYCGLDLPAGTKRLRYCSHRCRQGAYRQRHSIPLEPAGDPPTAMPPFSRPEDQIAQAILETRNLAGAFVRLGRFSRPQFSWRCEGLGKAIYDAVEEFFGDV